MFPVVSDQLLKRRSKAGRCIQVTGIGSHSTEWILKRIKKGMHSDPAAFIFFRLKEAHCNQQKTLHFRNRSCLWPLLHQ